LSANVWHGLRVVMAQPALGATSLQLVSRLRAIGVASTADLTHVGVEHAQFVLRLLENDLAEDDGTRKESLFQLSAHGGTHFGGNRFLRSKVAAYVTRFVGRGVASDDVFVGPRRSTTYRTLVLALRDSAEPRTKSAWLANAAAKHALESAAASLLDVYYGPDSLYEMVELVALFEPAAVVYALQSDSREDAEQLGSLVTACENRGIPLILDGTATFRITSGTDIGGGISALAEHPLGAYPLYLIALERSDAYPEMALSLVIHPREPVLHRALIAAALVTHATLPAVPVSYYGWVFDDMTVFRIWERDENELGAFERSRSQSLPRRPLQGGQLLRAAAVDAFLPPSVGDCSPAELALQSELDMAPVVRDALVPALLAASATTAAPAPAELTAASKGVVDMIEATRDGLQSGTDDLYGSVLSTSSPTKGRPMFNERNVVFADSILLLLQHIAHALTMAHGGKRPRIGAPAGGSPVLPVFAAALGLPFETISSGSASDGWKITPAALSAWAANDESTLALVLLCAPVSVTGSVYTQKDLDALVDMLDNEQCARGTYLVADETLALFDAVPSDAEEAGVHFKRVSSLLCASKQHSRVLTLGSFALDLAAPGFQTAWCVSANDALIQTIKSCVLEAPYAFALRMTAQLCTEVMRAATWSPSLPSESKAGSAAPIQPALHAFWSYQLSQLNSNRSVCVEQFGRIASVVQLYSDATQQPQLSVRVEFQNDKQAAQVAEQARSIGIRTRVVGRVLCVFLLQKAKLFEELLSSLCASLN